MRSFPAALSLLTLSLVICASSTASAQRDTAAAAAAFEAATRAQVQGDYAGAARLFEVAHRAAPSHQALRSAIRMRRQAGDHARAASLALEAQRDYADDATTSQLANETLTALAPSLVRLRVRCDMPCTVQVNGILEGRNALTSWDFYVAPGQAAVQAGFGDRGMSPIERVEGQAGQTMTLSFDAPEAAPEPPAVDPDPTPEPLLPPADNDEASGPPPALFWTSVGLSAVLTGITIGLTVNTLNAVDAYEANPTRERFNAGEDKQRRMYTFAALSGVAITGTVVLGLLTQFGGADDDTVSQRRPRVSLLADRSSVGLSLAGGF